MLDLGHLLARPAPACSAARSRISLYDQLKAELLGRQPSDALGICSRRHRDRDNLKAHWTPP
jgi:hypothetical protein